MEEGEEAKLKGDASLKWDDDEEEGDAKPEKEDKDSEDDDGDDAEENLAAVNGAGVNLIE